MSNTAKSSIFPGSFYILAEKEPDGVPAKKISPWSKAAFDEIYHPRLWVAAATELVGSASLVYVSGTLAMGLAQRDNYAYVIVGAVYNFILLSLHIIACAPASGGHLNSAITISAFTCGLASPVRTVLYIIAQLIGSVIGGSLARAAVGANISDRYQNGACVYDRSVVSIGSALATEISALFVLIFLAFGVVLDTRQRNIFGPIFGPLAIGLAQGTGVSITALLRPGFPSAGLNPSRCFGLAIPVAAFEGHWITWLGAVVVGCLIGAFHLINHPDNEEGFFPPLSHRTEREASD